MSTAPALSPWPYPRWIAHRGAGLLAPENTLAAFRLGAAHGYRMFECDAKLSADGVIFLWHDDTLDRTSNASGLAAQKNWHELSQLDAGHWHSPAYAGEAPCTLQALANWCLANQCALNIEIKPCPGRSEQTGLAVALAAAELWANAPIPPLLSSFDLIALQAAAQAAPHLPRAVLAEQDPEIAIAQAAALQCVAVVLEEALWQPDTLQAAQRAGLRRLSYTVNTVQRAQELVAAGLDGIITDAIDQWPVN